MTRCRYHNQRTRNQRFMAWRQKYHTTDMVQQAEAQTLCNDMTTLLTYVRDYKVMGTQSTGNMQLKFVRAVTAQFVNPPQLDTTIGNHTYRLRSEEDVWSLHFLRILGEVGGLLSIAPGKCWQLTQRGAAFLTLDAFLQLSQLLSIWWLFTNWLIAYPFEGMGEALPHQFNLVTLKHLRALPTETELNFEQFADKLIQRTGLTWTSADKSMHQGFLRSSIARMVIYILANFGAVTYQMREEPLGKGTIKELDTFQITPLGKALLEGLEAVRE